MHDAEHPLEMHLLSRPELLCAVRAAVGAVASRFGLREPDNDRVVLAVDEALTNVIRHGYHGQSDHPITVRIGPAAVNGRSGMEIEILDQCPDVNLEQIRGRSLEDVRPGGLGVNILRQVMDDVVFEHRSDRPGVRLVMRKFAPPDLSHDATTTRK